MTKAVMQENRPYFGAIHPYPFVILMIHFTKISLVIRMDVSNPERVLS
ncbi:MAG: hypothetical protein K6C07_05070 [Bacteroidales bacterium]|nr:hypothetical protein [Bacteroidales bacterium]